MKGASLDDQTDVAGLGNDLEGLSRPQDGRSGQCIRTNPLARLDTAQSHQPLDGCISTLPERLEQPDLSGSSLDILDPKRLSLPNGTARDPARPVEQDPRFQPDGRTSATVEVDPPPPQVHSGAQAVEISRGEENVASGSGMREKSSTSIRGAAPGMSFSTASLSAAAAVAAVIDCTGRTTQTSATSFTPTP